MTQIAELTGLKYYHIVAVNNHNGIGKRGTIPWHSAADLAHFKATTMNQIVIVGRTTYDSLPPHKLTGRHLIVVSHTLNESGHPEHVHVVRSINEAYLIANIIAQDWALDRAFIAGGSEIYNQTTHVIDGIFLTKIDDDSHCDTFYPEYHLKMLKPVMNKSLDSQESGLAATVTEYGPINIFE